MLEKKGGGQRKKERRELRQGGERERVERTVWGFREVRIQEAEAGGEGLRPAWAA